MGCWRGGWPGPSSLHALSLLSSQRGLRLEGDTPEVQLQQPLPPPTAGLHLAGHCCLAVGGWTWSLTPSGETSAQTPQYPRLSGVSGVDGNRKGVPGMNRCPERCHPNLPNASVHPLEAKPLKLAVLASSTRSTTVSRAPGVEEGSVSFRKCCLSPSRGPTWWKRYICTLTFSMATQVQELGLGPAHSAQPQLLAVLRTICPLFPNQPSSPSHFCCDSRFRFSSQTLFSFCDWMLKPTLSGGGYLLQLVPRYPPPQQGGGAWGSRESGQLAAWQRACAAQMGV